MRTLVIRVMALVFVAVLVLAVAVVALGYQPKVLPTYSGAVPDVECPFGVSPAQSFCYATAPPRSTQASKAPDTDVPPASTQASTAP
jgi:hypothetical protein